MRDDSDFPLDSTEISESVRHQMAFKILLDVINKIIHRSNVRLTGVPPKKNIQLDSSSVLKIVKSKCNLSDNGTATTTTSTISDDKSLSSMPSMPIIDPSDLAERTFFMPIDENRQCL